MTPLQQAIIDTNRYAQRFGGSLTKEEIKERLLSPQVFGPGKIEKAVKALGIKLSSAHPPWRREKIAKAEMIVKKFQNWQEIVFIGVTGSVAAGYPDKEEDIDLLVITRADSLWWTRLKIKWWLGYHKIEHRSYWGAERKDSLCLNLWLDAKALGLPKKKTK